jgi:hypothetical protein
MNSITHELMNSSVVNDGERTYTPGERQRGTKNVPHLGKKRMVL